ncbi:hypothetical protein Tco_1259922 [Tanacetum coccineum]
MNDHSSSHPVFSSLSGCDSFTLCYDDQSLHRIPCFRLSRGVTDWYSEPSISYMAELPLHHEVVKLVDELVEELEGLGSQLLNLRVKGMTENLLPTILAQVSNQGSNQEINKNQNGDAMNDNIQGDVRNVIGNNGRRGCSYKEFLACNPKEYDRKGGAIVYTRWVEKMESVQDMSGCSVDQKVKYTNNN